jgi:serine/threonine protein phosphatase PrpC
MLTVSLRTHPGTVRAINEDTILWDPGLSLLAVADGMGGHNAGEVASRLAIETIRMFLQKSAESHDCTWPFGVDVAVSLEMNRLRTAVKLANRRIFRESEERVEYTGMGTTVVAALAAGPRVTFVSVGDSRIYIVGERELQQVSRDDSFMGLLSKEAGLDAKALDKHPLRHVLTNVVGARPEIEVSGDEFELHDGQAILLCSDGLYGAVPEPQLHALATSDGDLDRAADAMLRTAIESMADDNVSLLLARYTADR